MVPMPVRVNPPPADTGEIISPGCAFLAIDHAGERRPDHHVVQLALIDFQLALRIPQRLPGLAVLTGPPAISARARANGPAPAALARSLCDQALVLAFEIEFRAPRPTAPPSPSGRARREDSSLRSRARSYAGPHVAESSSLRQYLAFLDGFMPSSISTSATLSGELGGNGRVTPRVLSRSPMRSAPYWRPPWLLICRISRAVRHLQRTDICLDS